jgi:hypothetical protein
MLMIDDGGRLIRRVMVLKDTQEEEEESLSK